MSSLNVLRYKELLQSPEFRTIVDELGLIPVDWWGDYAALRSFKINSLPFEGVSSLSQREMCSIIENVFFVQLDLFGYET